MLLVHGLAWLGVSAYLIVYVAFGGASRDCAGLFAGAALVALTVVVVSRMVRRRRWRRRHERLPAQPDPAFRLRCVGAPEDLLVHGPLHDVPFEPRLFWMPVGLRGKGDSGWLPFVVGLATLGAAILVGGAIGGGNGVTVPVVLAGLFVGTLLVAVLTPSYLRISPGRLELVTWRPVGGPTVQAYDLRTKPVFVDSQQYVLVLGSDDDRERLEFSFAAAPGRAAIPYYLFLAALSSYVPPTQAE